VELTINARSVATDAYEYVLWLVFVFILGDERDKLLESLYNLSEGRVFEHKHVIF
jgi:hypothetical protein